MRTILLLVASVLLILTGCAQQSHVSEPGGAIGGKHKSAIALKRKPHPASSQRGARRGDRDPSDVWTLVEDGLTFAHDVPDRKVQRHIDWYTGNDAYFNRTLERAQRYLPYVVDQLRENDMPMELAILPFIESAYNPFAYSHSHASGLWQFIPATGREMGLRQDWWYEGRRDIIDSTEAAIRYLKILNGIFDGDWLLTLAAYNGGPGYVGRAVEDNRRRGRPTDFWSLDLREETRNYVPQIVALSKVLSDPEQYGVNRFPIPAKPHFAVVEVKDQVDLAQAAKLAGISADDMYNLNPGFSRWVTPPDGPFRLLLPSERVEGFLDRLASTPRQTWHPGGEYVVRAGDTLGRIAANHGISVNDLTQLNSLDSSHIIRVGQVLRLPASSTAASNLASSVATTSRASNYQVRAGDSLWNIARGHGVPLADLLSWNNLSANAVISPGQQLRVTAPATTTQSSQVRYEVKQGDSLYDIARRFQVEVTDILAWNNLELRQVIRPGQNLTLYPR